MYCTLKELQTFANQLFQVRRAWCEVERLPAVLYSLQQHRFSSHYVACLMHNCRRLGTLFKRIRAVTDDDISLFCRFWSTAPRTEPCT